MAMFYIFAKRQQTICHIFHADIERFCHITWAKFSIYTGTFYFAHSTLQYLFVNETLPYVLIHTSIFFYNKPTLQKKHCSWELSLSWENKRCMSKLMSNNCQLIINHKYEGYIFNFKNCFIAICFSVLKQTLIWQFMENILSV